MPEGAAAGKLRLEMRRNRRRPTGERILFLVSAHNGLSQRAWVALTELGHDVAVAVVDSGAEMEAAVAEHRPSLVVCPFLKRRIPQSIWSRHRCLVVHPGPVGDRGPSSLDWAIELGAGTWGVTVLEANGEFDAGRVWATREFPMRDVGKSSIYRHEVRHAAVEALLEAIGQIAKPGCPPEMVGHATVVGGAARPLMTQGVRAIEWEWDGTDVVLRKIRAAEGHPGVLDAVQGAVFHLFGGHRERVLRGQPGEIIATRAGAICRATCDGAVWITHLKPEDTLTQKHFKLPATLALALAGIEIEAPEIGCAIDAANSERDTYREISYRERAGVGYLRFDFYNGAMSTQQCERLREAYAHARARFAHERDRVARRRRLFLQRHSPERDRGRQRPGRGVLAQPGRDQRPRPRHRADRVAPRGLSPRRRCGSRRGASSAGRRLRRRPRGRSPESLLPAHGRPVRLGVLDLPTAPTGRIPDRRRPDQRAVHPARRPTTRHGSACWTPCSVPRSPPSTTRPGR